ncbi:MAG: flagellar motor switch protein FliN [Anaerolineales bacterium]|nr:flagellar motor switch protein FliN [Anaerolineales bacterium]
MTESPLSNLGFEAEADPAGVAVRPAHFETLNGSGSAAGQTASIDLLMDVPLRVTVELGRTRMSVRQVLELQSGSVVELDRLAGEAVDVMVNDRLMARGEVVVVDDKFGIRITEIVAGNRRE